MNSWHEPTLYRLEDMMPLIRETLANGNSVTLAPNGTSMLPMLRQGIDTVTLSPLPARLRKFDIPFYQRSNGQYVLHRVVTVGDTYTCIGDNQFVFEHGLRHDQMIAVVTSFTRGDMVYSVNSLRYRLYCRFWHYSRPVRLFWRMKLKPWLRPYAKPLLDWIRGRKP